MLRISIPAFPALTASRRASLPPLIDRLRVQLKGFSPFHHKLQELRASRSHPCTSLASAAARRRPPLAAGAVSGQGKVRRGRAWGTRPRRCGVQRMQAVVMSMRAPVLMADSRRGKRRAIGSERVVAPGIRPYQYWKRRCATMAVRAAGTEAPAVVERVPHRCGIHSIGGRGGPSGVMPERCRNPLPWCGESCNRSGGGGRPRPCFRRFAGAPRRASAVRRGRRLAARLP